MIAFRWIFTTTVTFVSHNTKKWIPLTHKTPITTKLPQLQTAKIQTTNFRNEAIYFPRPYQCSIDKCIDQPSRSKGGVWKVIGRWSWSFLGFVHSAIGLCSDRENRRRQSVYGRLRRPNAPRLSETGQGGGCSTEGWWHSITLPYYRSGRIRRKGRQGLHRSTNTRWFVEDRRDRERT